MTPPARMIAERMPAPPGAGPDPADLSAILAVRNLAAGLDDELRARRPMRLRALSAISAQFRHRLENSVVYGVLEPSSDCAGPRVIVQYIG